MLEKEFLEAHAPVLALCADRLVSDPEWSLKLLETTTNQLLPPWFRQIRNTTENLSLAIEAGLKVVQYCPNCLDDILALSLLLAKAERLEEGLVWVDKAIKLNTENAGYYRLRASLLERLGQVVEAEKAIQVAIKLQPDVLELLEDQERIFNLAVEIYRRDRDEVKEVSLAIDAGLKVVEYCPNNFDDISALSLLLAKAERLEEALSWIDLAIKLNNENADFHRIRASLLERLGHHKSAYHAAQKAHLLNPLMLELLPDIKRIRRKVIFKYLGLQNILVIK